MITKADILQIRSLADKRARTQNGLFVAEGEKIVEELAGSSFNVRKIYTTETSDRIKNSELVSEKEMDRMSLLKTPTPALALIEIPKHRVPHMIGNRLVLALDQVQDPGNMGTIIRLADWFGIKDIFCSEDSADCFNPKVVQATMGAILRVRVHYTNIEEMITNEKSHGTPIFGTFLEGDNIYKAPLSEHGIIVMGNEGRGISTPIAELVDHKLFIPSYPVDRPNGSESLNVAIATAIVCAAFRQASI